MRNIASVSVFNSFVVLMIVAIGPNGWAQEPDAEIGLDLVSLETLDGEFNEPIDDSSVCRCSSPRSCQSGTCRGGRSRQPSNCGRCGRPRCILARLLAPDRERVLPILGNAARRAGYDIPLPIGVGGNIAYIDQAMDIHSISLAVGGAPAFPLDEIPPFRLKSRDTNVSSRVDVWVLPFLNV